MPTAASVLRNRLRTFAQTYGIAESELSSALCMYYLNDWQTEFNRETEYLINDNTADPIETVADQEGYDLPADCRYVYKAILNGDPVTIVSNQQYFTVKRNRSSDATIETDTIVATNYRGQILINPTPAGGYELDLHYLARPATIDSWTTTATITTEPLRAMDTYGGSVALAVGDHGTIVYTANGGASWTVRTKPTNVNLRGVFLISATVAVVVGEHGVILYTDDAGATWTVQTSGVTTFLNAVHFTSATVGWVVGSNGTILYTADTGTTWTAQTSATYNALYGVSAASATIAMAVGYGGTILYTANAGTTWTTQTSGVTTALRDVVMTETTSAFAVGDAGKILYTANSGTTWTAQTSGVTVNLNSVTFGVVSVVGWVVGDNGTILYTANTGTTWTAQTSGSVKDLLGTIAYGPSLCFAVGLDGVILNTTNAGTGWNQAADGTTYDVEVVFPSEFDNAYIHYTLWNLLTRNASQAESEQATRRIMAQAQIEQGLYTAMIRRANREFARENHPDGARANPLPM